MNLTSELKKPVFLSEAGGVTLRELAMAQRAGLHEMRSLLGVKFAAFASDLSALNTKVGHYTRTETRQLAIARLKATEPTKVYKFMSGQTFTAQEAIVEIEKGTNIGNYFAELEKRAAAIALEALATGKFKL